VKGFADVTGRNPEEEVAVRAVLEGLELDGVGKGEFGMGVGDAGEFAGAIGIEADLGAAFDDPAVAIPV
jgi:hypothetical protein